MKYILTPVLSFTASAVALIAQSVTYDFDDSSSAFSNLSYTENAVPSSMISDSGGINGSGFLEGASGGDSQFVIVGQNPIVFDTAAEATLSQSVFFKTTATAGEGIPAEGGGGAGQDVIILGLTDRSAQTVSNDYILSSFEDNYISNTLRVVSADDGAGGLTIEFKGYSTMDPATNWFGPGAQITLAFDSWYSFQVDYLYTTTGNFTFNYKLYEATEDGEIGNELFNRILFGAVRDNQFGENPSLNGFFASDTQLSSSILGFDDVMLVGTEAAASDPMWGEWVIDADGNVDTGDFLGWIYVSEDEWVYSYSLEKWIYAAESLVDSDGGWVFVPRN